MLWSLGPAAPVQTPALPLGQALHHSEPPREAQRLPPRAVRRIPRARDGKLLAQDLACRQLPGNINSHSQCLKQGLTCFWNELIVRMPRSYVIPLFPFSRWKSEAQRHQGACLSSGCRNPVSHSLPAHSGDKLLLYIPGKVGLKQGFPNPRPWGVTHQIRLNSSKNRLLSEPPGPLWRWKIDIRQLAPGWKDSPDSCPPCPPQAPPAPHHLVPDRSQHPPRLRLFPTTWRICGSQAPAVWPHGHGFAATHPGLIPLSFCLLAPRRPLSPSPYSLSSHETAWNSAQVQC